MCMSRALVKMRAATMLCVEELDVYLGVPYFTATVRLHTLGAT